MIVQAAFLFDMDGTLVDSMPFHSRAWMELLVEFGVRMGTEEFLRQTSGKTNCQILREVLGVPLSDAELSVFEERKESLFRSLCGPHLKPIAGMMEFLAESRRLGVPMAVATAAGRANREFALGGLGIGSYFDAIVGAEDVQNGKPHPEIFLRAAERLGADPAKCVVFEDALSGIEAAGRAGMGAVALTTSLAAREFRGHPAVIQIAGDYVALHPRALAETVSRPRPGGDRGGIPTDDGAAQEHTETHHGAPADPSLDPHDQPCLGRDLQGQQDPSG
jgi:beta-phosphoglucomutase family hydrolase